MTPHALRRGLIAVLMALSVSVPPNAHAQATATQDVRNVYDLLNKVYGINRAPTCSRTSFTVGITATRVSNNAPNAISIALGNEGTSACAYGYDSSVTTSTGMPLQSSGGGVSEDFRNDLVAQTYEHWVICSAASQAIVVVQCSLN